MKKSMRPTGPYEVISAETNQWNRAAVCAWKKGSNPVLSYPLLDCDHCELERTRPT